MSPGAQFSVGYNVCVPTAGSVVMGVPPGSRAWLGRTLVGAEAGEAGVVAVGGPGAADHGTIV